MLPTMESSTEPQLTSETVRDGVDTRKQDTDNLPVDTITGLGMSAAKQDNTPEFMEPAPTTPALEDRFMTRLLDEIRNLLEKNLPTINRRCAAYEKGKKTQDKGINKNFEKLVEHATRNVLTGLGMDFWPAILDVRSDVSLETEHAIFQVDAKGCHNKDREFLVRPRDKYLHGHCGIAQTSLVSTALYTDRKTGEKTEQKGRQKSEVDGKPVYTFVVFMRWGYTTQYVAESCGVVYLPHMAKDVEFRGGKSPDEMRWVIKNPRLYRIHQFASQSPLQIPDSVQSVCSETQETLPQSQ